MLGASSDHLVVDSGRHRVFVGAEMTFHLNYSALLRAMTSPFVTKVVKVASSVSPVKVHRGDVGQVHRNVAFAADSRDRAARSVI